MPRRDRVRFWEIIKRIGRNAEPWPHEQAEQLRLTSQRCAGMHDCAGSRSVEMRENCGACALAGYGVGPGQAPNYAGWLRDYIQRGNLSRGKAAVAELIQARKENMAYYEAIRRDVATFLHDGGK